MKSRLVRIAHSVVLAAFGLFGLQPSVHAITYTSQHASICRPAGFAEGPAVFLNVDGEGITNWHWSAMTVVCPIIRNGVAPEESFTVWIDGYAAGPTTCTLYSQDYMRNPLGSTSATVVSNTFDMSLTLSALQVGPYSTQVVVCTIQSGASLWDIEVTNN